MTARLHKKLVRSLKLRSLDKRGNLNIPLLMDNIIAHQDKLIETFIQECTDLQPPPIDHIFRTSLYAMLFSRLIEHCETSGLISSDTCMAINELLFNDSLPEMVVGEHQGRPS